jgi:hypothetical protein
LKPIYNHQKQQFKKNPDDKSKPRPQKIFTLKLNIKRMTTQESKLKINNEEKGTSETQE